MLVVGDTRGFPIGTSYSSRHRPVCIQYIITSVQLPGVWSTAIIYTLNHGSIVVFYSLDISRASYCGPSVSGWSQLGIGIIYTRGCNGSCGGFPCVRGHTTKCL